MLMIGICNQLTWVKDHVTKLSVMDKMAAKYSAIKWLVRKLGVHWPRYASGCLFQGKYIRKHVGGIKSGR